MNISGKKITKRDLIWIIICLVIILCFFIGMLTSNDIAQVALSGASTVVSIILSVIAIFYTMIDGANSARLNQETINKLSNIDAQLKEATEKISEFKDLDRRIKAIIPSTIGLYEKAVSITDSSKDEFIEKNIEYLKRYIDEDVDE